MTSDILDQLDNLPRAIHYRIAFNQTFIWLSVRLWLKYIS